VKSLLVFFNCRYTPGALPLAIQEIDEKHVGTVNFRTREGLLQVSVSGDVLNHLCLSWELLEPELRGIQLNDSANVQPCV
jgi:hypothetical protein